MIYIVACIEIRALEGQFCAVIHPAEWVQANFKSWASTPCCQIDQHCRCWRTSYWTSALELWNATQATISDMSC